MITNDDNNNPTLETVVEAAAPADTSRRTRRPPEPAPSKLTDAAPMEPARQLNPDDHPMLNLVERPRIRTRPTERLASAIVLGIEAGNCGMMVDGDGRVGKDTGFMMLSQDSSWRPFPLAFFNVSWPLCAKSSETYFSNQFLLTGNCKTAKPVSGNTGIFRTRNLLLSHAAHTGADIIVVGVFEAQRMHREDYGHLITLENEFRETRKRLYVVLINQRDADTAGVQTIDRGPPPELVGRYKGNRHHFTGLLWEPLPCEEPGAGDVSLALAEYDDTLRWPEPDGPTYTEFFAPRAYAAGWRLSGQVDLIRKVIETMRAEQGMVPTAPWPMKTFEAFVYFALVRTAGADPTFTGLSELQVRECVRRSGYIDLELSRVPEGRR